MKRITGNTWFRLGMRWKIFYGSLRVLLGVAIFSAVGTPVLDIVTRLMRHELVEDPSDVVYRLAHHALSAHPVTVSHFLALYFIFWGILDVVLSIHLLKDNTRVFLPSMTLIGLFTLYETVRFAHTGSLILLSVILIDIVVLALIHREYKRLKARKRKGMV